MNVSWQKWSKSADSEHQPLAPTGKACLIADIRKSAAVFRDYFPMYLPSDFQRAGIGVHPISAGLFVGDGRMVRRRMIHTGMGMSFDIEGTAHEIMEHGEFLVRPGEVICLWPQKWHDVTEHQRQPLQTIWCELTGPAVPEVIHLFGVTPDAPIVRPVNEEEVHALFKEIVAGFHAAETLHPGHFLQRFHRIAELCAQGHGAHASPSRRAAETLVQRAIRICETGMLTFPTVAQLARQLAVSQNTLLHACRRELGISAVELIVRIKLDKARELLRTTDHKLLSIAQACGFRSPSHFIHTFRSAEKTTPEAWRRKQQTGGRRVLPTAAQSSTHPFSPKPRKAGTKRR